MVKLKYKILVGGIVVVGAIGIWMMNARNEVDIEKGSIDLERMKLPVSGLSGERCENAKNRPLAAMLSSDPETRPLAGLAEADLVFEMPVTDGGVTRLMAVFQCWEPEEIGSIRSSRMDFIPLVQGLGAVYVHWGGEREALAQLNKGVVDNIDGLRHDGTIYYRKKGLKPPHNGFTSHKRLKEEVVRRGWNIAKRMVDYAHAEGQSQGIVAPPVIYANEFAVEWKYQPDSNKYERRRNQELEIDRNLKRAVEAKNVVLMKTGWTPISRDYIRVKTVGRGLAMIYKNGQEIKGSWEKKGDRDKLFFFDEEGREIKFTPGPLWVEILIDI